MSVRLMRMAAAGGIAHAFTAEKFAFFAAHNIGFDGISSPIMLPGGRSLSRLVDSGPLDGPMVESLVHIIGFSSDPGSGYLSSVICNGVSLASSAASYTYNSGIALWQWNQTFGMAEGNQYIFRLFLS